MKKLARSFAIALLFGTVAAPICAAQPFDAPAPPTTSSLDDPKRVGVRHGTLYVRDRRDILRLYPHAELNLDLHATLGAGSRDVPKAAAGADLGTRFLVRRASFELAGELFQRIAFNVGLNVVSNPAIDGARVVGTDSKVALEDAWGAVDAGRGLSLRMGVYQAPFSLENRTARSELAMMERNVAIRGFAVPGGKVLGGSFEGGLRRGVLRWAVGAFAAERVAVNRFDRSFSAQGRVTTQPFALSAGSALRQLLIGASARIGSRNTRDAAHDAPAVATGQGYALYRPTRVDAQGRVVRAVLSGTQWAAGGELLLPLAGFALRAEGYWVSRSMVESVQGQSPFRDPLRAGRLAGVAWYVELSCWVLEALRQVKAGPRAFGDFPRSEHLELADTGPEADRYGFEIAALAAGVHGVYKPASRGGEPDLGLARGVVEIYQLGLAANYWHTRHFRLSFNPTIYWVPAAGREQNLAVLPGDLSPMSVHSFRSMWELSARAALFF